MKRFLSGALGLMLLGTMLLGTALVGCGSKTNDAVLRAGRDRVIAVKGTDAEMNAAVAKAKANLGSFISALQRPTPTQRYFAVKVPFRERGQTEHMWVTKLSYDSKKQTFRGILSNAPNLVHNVKQGQIVSVKRSEVSDWVYADGKNARGEDKLFGAYTSAVLEARERKLAP